VILALLALAASGCTPSIGDKCSLSTDCSLRGDRLCDTSQPGGYCTVFNCGANSCPDQAACVLFNPSIQGCGYNDRSPSRTGRSFCLAKCGSDGDCRAGYTCSDPRGAPWSAIILDDDQSKLVCIAPPIGGVSSDDGGFSSESDAAVCGPSNPPVPGIDASPPAEIDASMTDAGVDAADAADAADAGGSDAQADVADAGAGDADDSG